MLTGKLIQCTMQVSGPSNARETRATVTFECPHCGMTVRLTSAKDGNLDEIVECPNCGEDCLL